MDRIIEVRVGGNYISKDSKYAGVRGESYVTNLRITFDEGWDNYTKSIIFWDARGLNPVEVELLPSMADQSGRTYLVPIPKEPMTETGKLTFVIEGTGIEDGKKVQRSVSDKLEVRDAPIAENAGQPVPPTPDQLTQLQGEIEKTKDDILAARKATESITNMTVSSQQVSSGYGAYVEKTTQDGYMHIHFGIPQGEKGDKGDTPKAGVDYWTPEEKQAITNYVAERVGETEEAVETIRAIQEALLNAEPITNIFKDFALQDLSNVSDEVLRAKIESLLAATVSEPVYHTHTPEEIGASPIGHTHTASEVGASPIGHTHTASEVGASPVGHTHSASEVGAAPASHTHTPSNIGLKTETWTFTLENGSTVTKAVYVG